MLTRMIPASAVPNCASTHSLTLADQMPTRSPFSRPSLRKPDGQVLGPAQEVGVSPAHVLVAGDLREALRPLRRDAAQKLADRLADQRRRRRAVNVGLREQRH